jgi:hypothetical protein
MRRWGRKALPLPWGSAVDGETTACQAPSCCLVPVHCSMLLPTLLPSSVDHTIVPRPPSHCCHPRCFLPSSTPLLSAIDTHVIVAHIVVAHVVVYRCRHCRHDHHFCHYCCRFLAECCLWTLPGVLLAAPSPLFVMLFGDVVLPPWALALDNADSCQADARWSLSCCHPPPSTSVPAHSNGLFALLLLLLLSPALAAAAAQ